MGSLVTEELLSLRWKDFESNFIQSFSEMRDDSDFFDVKIACLDNESEMKTIPAHKMVLSACSPVFKKLLRAIGNGDSKNPLLFLSGISHEEMCAILNFMYNGETKVQHKYLDAFLAAAEKFKIKGLTQENQINGGNSINSTPSRKRPSQDQQLEDNYENAVGIKSKIKKTRPLSPVAPKQQESFKNNVGLKSKIKKTKTSPSNVQAKLSTTSAGVPVPEKNAGKVVVKAEKVDFEAGNDDYQDCTEGEMDDPFDDSNLQEHEKDETDNIPAEGAMDDPFNESTQQDDVKAENSNVSLDSKGRFTFLSFHSQFPM